VAEDIEKCVRNFYNSEAFAMLKELPQENWLGIEDFSLFYLDGKKIWAVIDCSFRTDDGITIIDWKTGRIKASPFIEKCAHMFLLSIIGGSWINK
jgi:ATP-dependent exoDNAse (exonuclease V) beta subunit